jgi:Peptidase M15
MLRAAGAIILLIWGSAAIAAETDFGIRELGKAERSSEPPPAGEWANSSGRSVDMADIKQIGAHWGQVTSTFRSPAHNRRVGGVANSYHLRNRAIDIARRSGISHSQIAAAYRAAGYSLAESLDEGDHSHFAFGAPGGWNGPRPQMVAVKSGEKTEWHIVYAPPSSSSAGGN